MTNILKKKQGIIELFPFIGIAMLTYSVALLMILSKPNMPRVSRYEEARDGMEALIMRDYVPVGNGGALAGMHGKISPARRAMYDKIHSDLKTLDQLSGFAKYSR